MKVRSVLIAGAILGVALFHTACTPEEIEIVTSGDLDSVYTDPIDITDGGDDDVIIVDNSYFDTDEPIDSTGY